MTLLTMLIGLLAVVGASAARADGETLQGTLVNKGTPVAGVSIAVTQDGSKIDTTKTGKDGAWSVDVPGPGDYTVKVDTDSFPKGVNLRNPEKNSLTVTVAPQQQRAILFPLGKDTRQTTGTFDRFLSLLLGGIRYGLIIGLAALGLSMIFGTTGLVNFAHGELVTLGALIAYYFNVVTGLPFLLAAVIAVVVTGVAGGLLDLGLWRQLRRRGTGLVAQLVVSIGLSLLLRYLFLFIFGGRTKPYDAYQAQRGLELGPVTVAPRDLWVIGICIIVIIGISLALQRTRFGKATRAVADNPALAASSGINVDQVILLVWVVGVGLAGLAGIMQTLSEQISWQTGFQLLLLIFAAVILGGLGTAYGALVGSLVVGIFIQVSTLVIPTELKNVGALLILIVVLMIRPQGILGRAERVG